MPPRSVPIHHEPEEEVTMDPTETPAHATVLPGESFQQFCDRVGVSPDRVRQLNELEMAEVARARGFDAHTFMRRVPNEDGTVSDRSDCHVFVGQVLRLVEGV